MARKKSKRRGSKLLYVGSKESLMRSWGSNKNVVVRKLPDGHPETHRGGWGVYRKIKERSK